MKTKKHRLKGKRDALLPIPKHKKKPNGFEVRSLQAADGRFKLIRELRRQLETAKEHCAAESIFQEWICARAVFIAAWLESQEIAAGENQDFQISRYVQECNSLVGLCRALSPTLQKQVSPTVDELDSILDKGKRR